MSKSGAALFLGYLFSLTGLTVEDFIENEMDDTKTEDEKQMALIEKSNERLGVRPNNHTPRHHGFTCPKCGGHYFGTNLMLNGHDEGYCKSERYGGTPCDFKWDRSNKTVEESCFHWMSRSEWLEHYAKE